MKQSSKWLVRTLIILGIGIPVVVELTTLLGLVGNSFNGKGANEKNSTTERAERIETGSELLPETSQSEILKSAYVWAGSDTWEFSMTISISGLENVHTLSFSLDSLETRDGNMVNEPVTFDKNAVNTDSTYLFKANWNIPQGDQPKSINVKAIYNRANDSLATDLHRRLVFNKVPVRARK